ncbi:efflux transporter outer membrane subunit [Ramlibacter ginsenosidimutans]|uniref:Efflux transporter outer membrane subunit n=1 Tax=Ramlibacter ginsenosidimutans TaxID=502333 RepID=A0A934WPK1_9BURK|nr:efflux transporter outer membrane subunit [Ramlibacter ginsenosidimutans]MBK6008523.1 efflux transporter outer membrane subunit [Ramlibacter ginsenosidimutans]
MDRSALRPLALAAAAALAGCALVKTPDAPQLKELSLPNTQLPSQWTAAPTPPGPVVNGWLTEFHDPQLEKLVAEAMTYNPDLQIAAARVEAAEASARAAGAALYPQVNLAGHGGGKLGGDGSGVQGIGLFASWELDLWGRVRAQRAAATAQYESQVLDTAYARQSIAALVAKSWFLAREAAVQRALAGEMISSSQALVDLSRDRVRVGKTDELEVSQAEASALSYSDLQLQAEIARQNALRAIEILAGRYPSATVEPGLTLPALPGPVPAGLPSELLERRPDVRAAERRVAAAFYRTQQAQAARLPTISLTAGVSSITSELFVMKERDNPVWSVGGTLLAPIFNAGALQAQVDVRTAEQKAAIADYGRIGSRAFGEVESALSQSFNLDTRADVLVRAVRANESAVGYARTRFEVGSSDLRGVQQQQLALHAARATLAHVQAERLIQRVNLHLALGGGFEP